MLYGQNVVFILNINSFYLLFDLLIFILSKSKDNGRRVKADSESKENQPPEGNVNGVSNQTDMVDNVRKSENGHNDKVPNNTEYQKVMERLNNQKAVDKITLDYPELGLAEYGSMMSGDQSVTNNGPSRNGFDGLGTGPGSLNGLSPLNKSQIISRRLKLDLRNESEIPIAGSECIL